MGGDGEMKRVCFVKLLCLLCLLMSATPLRFLSRAMIALFGFGELVLLRGRKRQVDLPKGFEILHIYTGYPKK